VSTRLHHFAAKVRRPIVRLGIFLYLTCAVISSLQWVHALKIEPFNQMRQKFIAPAFHFVGLDQFWAMFARVPTVDRRYSVEVKSRDGSTRSWFIEKDRAFEFDTPRFEQLAKWLSRRHGGFDNSETVRFLLTRVPTRPPGTLRNVAADSASEMESLYFYRGGDRK